jgi:hypothetical protein
MEDLKSEEPAQPLWQGHRNPLPVPPRLLPSYDSTPPSSLAPPFTEVSAGNYHLMSNQTTNSPRNEKGSATAPRPPPESHGKYPARKRSYQDFEEPQYAQHVPESAQVMPEKDTRPKPTIHPDHRLLSFGQTQNRHTIFDQYGRPGILEITAQIHGMFFLSEIATSSGDSIIIQPELTCYRRNLFQISGSVACPAGPISALTDRGQTVPIVSQELSIFATESVDGHVIRLIVIPWKTPPPNAPEVPSNQEQEPPPITLLDHGEGGQTLSNGVFIHPIAWRRLQFRVATANNGRRKELQQHFVLRLSVTATLSDGTKLCIAEASTAPIVVRGRSPRNFQARKEIPLIGSSASARGQNSQISPVERDVVQRSENVRAHNLQSSDQAKSPFQFDTSNFPSSPLMLRQEYVVFFLQIRHKSWVEMGCLIFLTTSLLSNANILIAKSLIDAGRISTNGQPLSSRRNMLQWLCPPHFNHRKWLFQDIYMQA